MSSPPSRKASPSRPIGADAEWGLRGSRELSVPAANDAARPCLTVSLSGTGTAAFTVPVVLVDDGTFEVVVGFPNGGVNASFVTRLAPPRYPATLHSVQVYFPEGNVEAADAIPDDAGQPNDGFERPGSLTDRSTPAALVPTFEEVRGREPDRTIHAGTRPHRRGVGELVGFTKVPTGSDAVVRYTYEPS